MNEMQKRHILTLRQQGIGYAEIARRLDIKRETVKTYCRRHGLLTQEEALRYREVQKASRPRNTVVCKNCGTVFFATPCKHRVFCSHECYIHYRFRVQPTLREHEEILTFTRAELEKCFAEWLAELVRSGRVTVNDATLSAPRE